MRILFDLDGCLSDTDLLPAFHARGFCLGKDTSHVTHYYFEEAFAAEGVTRELVQEVLNSPGFYLSLRPHAWMVKGAWRLARLGHELHVVTARPSGTHVEDETEAWLARHAIPYTALAYEPDKRAYAQAEGCALVIEDKFETAVKCAEAGIPTLLVQAPYNTEHEHGRGALPLPALRLSPKEFTDFFAAFTPETESFLDAALDAGLIHLLQRGERFHAASLAGC